MVSVPTFYPKQLSNLTIAIWEPYVPLKYLTMIDGDPDLGKTWVAMSLAAAVSVGGPLFNKHSEVLRREYGVFGKTLHKKK